MNKANHPIPLGYDVGKQLKNVHLLLANNRQRIKEVIHSLILLKRDYEKLVKIESELLGEDDLRPITDEEFDKAIEEIEKNSQEQRDIETIMESLEQDDNEKD